MTTLIQEIERIKSMDTSRLNESTAKTAIVMPVLRALGWDTTDPDEVHLEYKVAMHLTGYADIALLVQDIPLILIETKAPNRSLKTAKHEIQVLEYCQMKRVKIGILTNGLEWRIYYLEAGADKNSSLARIVDLRQDKTDDSAKTLERLLSRDAVSDKRALTHARKLWHDSILSNLWKDLLAKGDESLVKRLRKEVKDKGGINIPLDDVRDFFLTRSALPATDQNPPPPENVAHPDTEANTPQVKPRGLLRMHARMFGTETEYKNARDVLVNFVLQACRHNKTTVEDLARRLEADGGKVLLIYSDGRPSAFRAPRRIAETDYWIEANYSRADIQKICDRIKQALSLPDDVLIWLDLDRLRIKE